MGISDDKTGIVARTSGAVLMRKKLGSVRTSIGHNGTHIWDMSLDDDARAGADGADAVRAGWQRGRRPRCRSRGSNWPGSSQRQAPLDRFSFSSFY